LFGVSRTIPATERKEFRKFVSSGFFVEQNSFKDLKEIVTDEVEKILGKDISKYSHVRVSQTGNVSLLAGKTKKGSQYSEFHFGAGESSIIRMIMEIESLPENSLILIEEIENGLHPIATTKMVEYLIEIADRKKITDNFHYSF
jgi:AAA15 family ATPase/GTPase